NTGYICMNLWSMLGAVCRRHGGQHSGHVDIALAPWAGVAPDSYYFHEGRQNIMIGGDYFCAAPDMIAEVLSAPSRALDRGPRMEVYRRAGVEHLWLLEPARETVEVYRLLLSPGPSRAPLGVPGHQGPLGAGFRFRRGWGAR